MTFSNSFHSNYSYGIALANSLLELFWGEFNVRVHFRLFDIMAIGSSSLRENASNFG